ncbi:penicillin acylase family protein [Bacillus alkalicellulosilyticus]|uniref:penicillin acylase family protein n=1 Tax=Alkalihalobacterium alkalicellulosilyticum TaxID=1912214 RepID=UPI000998B851|nr:penicillin acylase family protein [Bacillus alkalicellulosilyticus]
MKEVLDTKAGKRKTRTLTRILISILLVLLVVITSAALWGYIQLKKPVPMTSGEVEIRGLSQPVTVWRDEQGVPTIEAANNTDLYLAQGYVTAQERLFQMDLSRRQASGRLSEVVGEAALERDKFFRTFGLRRAAEASIPIYSEEAIEALEAYAAGVNTFIREAKANGTLPIEFRFMGYEPEPWTSVDSLTIGKFMAFDLSGNWQGQAFRYYLAQNFSDEEVVELLPSYPEDAPTVLQALREHDLDIEKSFSHAVIPDPFNGSNNWVISGERTTSGYPLLADDPHLSLATPSIWYQTHLKSPNVHVNGVIFAGIPGVILGNNEHIAWGVTNVGPDVQQLYIEKRNPVNPYQFEYMGEWEQAKVINEVIKIKDGDPVKHEVIITRHGPIFSEYAHDEQPDTALSLRWTAHDPSAELEAVLRFNRATNWDEFKEALTYFHTPAQNFVFAAKDGTIAYRANGLIPIRKNGDALMPVPGWTDEYEWDGYIPWEELPTSVNPESGFIATANNKIVEDDYPYHITHTWAQPFRMQRIVEVLEQTEALTVEDMKELQFDQLNLQGKELTPYLLEQVRHRADLRDIDKEAIALLENWNYIDDKDEGAPLVFHLWIGAFSDLLFEDRISEDMMKLFEGRAGIVDEMIRREARGEKGIWVAEKGGFSEVSLVSLQRAVDRITEEQGNNASKWAWGEFHAIPFDHPLSAIKPLHLLFNSAPTPVGGSNVTVMAAGWNAETGEVDHGAGWRGIFDVKDLTTTYHVVGPGQSGHVMSPWYDDQIEAWTTGEYHESSMNPKVYQNTKHELRLVPEM